MLDLPFAFYLVNYSLPFWTGALSNPFLPPWTGALSNPYLPGLGSLEPLPPSLEWASLSLSVYDN